MQASETVVHPAVSPENRAFWEAAAQGRLLIRHCETCGENHFYPRAQCPFCRSLDTSWREATGTGVIYSYTVMRKVAVPFAIAYVELSEGPMMFTNIVDCEFDALRIGQEVVVTFKAAEDGLTLPVFKPV
jgi:uncharacterized OB-fold protein